MLFHSLKLDLNAHIWRSHRILNGPQCPFLAVPTAYCWTSMSMSGDPTAYYWTSMSRGTVGIPCGGSRVAGRPRGRPRGSARGPGDGGGGDGFPRTLESGRSSVPTCPGTKYPVRGIPHFDNAIVKTLDQSLECLMVHVKQAITHVFQRQPC